MDKYEYNLKLDQIKNLVSDENYEAAAEIADTINWNKIKNVNALVKAGEVYEKVERYQESRDILLMAYDRSPIGRMIIYRLAEVAIKMGDFDAAEEYYNEFVEIAPHDNLRYVLKYSIMKGKGVSLEELIPVLEEFKEQEYTEEWAYELAYLYHKSGKIDKCIDACDELILWFGDGPYVERALELKMLYQPLTKTQEEKYRKFQAEKEGSTSIGEEEMRKAGEYIHEPVVIPKVEINPERFNTVNLQEEIAKGMQQIIDATEKTTVSDTMDNIKKIVEDVPYLQLPKENEITQETEKIPTDEEIDSSLKTNFQEMLGEESDGQISMVVKERTELEKQITGQMTIQDVLDEWEKTRRAAEVALQEAEQQKLESAKARALQEAGDIIDRLNDVKPMLDAGVTPQEVFQEQYHGIEIPDMQPIAVTDIPQDIHEVPSSDLSYLGIDQEIVSEEPLSEEQQFEGTLSDEIQAEDVRMEGTVPEEVQPEELQYEGIVPESVETEDIQFESPAPEDIQLEGAQVENTFTGAVQEEIPEETPASHVSLQDMLSDEAADVEMPFIEEPYIEPEIQGGVDSREELEELEQEVLLQPTEALPQIDIEESVPELDKGITKRMPVLKQRTAKIPDIPLPEDLDVPEEVPAEKKHIDRLSSDQRAIFSYFVPIKGMEEQICKAYNDISNHLADKEASNTGNLIIKGERGCGKTVLATSFIKILQKDGGQITGKIGKIDADALNQKDIQQLLRKITGGCLIIERAGELERKTAVALSLLMEHDITGTLYILEDTSKGIKKALSLDEGFASKFTEEIAVPIFTNDELVSFARSYSRELGYEIDEMAILALHNRISNIARLDQATTITEVKNIVDEAIDREAHGGIKKAFSILTAKRYTEDDRILLTERNFELK